MNPEPEYPYPNWKGRPIGDPAEVIKALRQCRKAWRATCTMPPEIRMWAGHYHGMGKKEYRRVLGERLVAFYGSLPQMPIAVPPLPELLSWLGAVGLWGDLIREGHGDWLADFYGVPPAPSKPLFEPEESIEPGGWLSRAELVAEHTHLREALDGLTAVVRELLEDFLPNADKIRILTDAFDTANEILDATE